MLRFDKKTNRQAKQFSHERKQKKPFERLKPFERFFYALLFQILPLYRCLPSRSCRYIGAILPQVTPEKPKQSNKPHPPPPPKARLKRRIWPPPQIFSTQYNFSFAVFSYIYLFKYPTKIFFLFYILFETKKSLTSCKNKIKAVCCRLIHFWVEYSVFRFLQFQQ